jgi:hypothetical protein
MRSKRRPTPTASKKLVCVGDASLQWSNGRVAPSGAGTMMASTPTGPYYQPGYMLFD